MDWRSTRARQRYGPDQAALADDVLLQVSERLAPRYAVKPGVSTQQLLEVQGMTLARYAQLNRLLEPFGGQLISVDGDRIVYQVNGSAEQLRSQLTLAQMHEVPADQAPAQLRGRSCSLAGRFSLLYIRAGVYEGFAAVGVVWGSAGGSAICVLLAHDTDAFFDRDAACLHVRPHG